MLHRAISERGLRLQNEGCEAGQKRRACEESCQIFQLFLPGYVAAPKRMLA